jgi:hypothetical protein
MLVDANLVLFAVHRESAFHAEARDRLSELNGSRRVGSGGAADAPVAGLQPCDASAPRG